METPGFSFDQHWEIPAGDLSSPKGIADGSDGLLYVIGGGGSMARVDPETGAIVMLTLNAPTGFYRDVTAAPDGAPQLYLLRTTNGQTKVDVWNLATDLPSYDIASSAIPDNPVSLTDGPNGLLYLVGSGGGYAALDPSSGSVIVSHDQLDFPGRSVSVTNLGPTATAARHVPYRPAHRAYLSQATPNPFNPRTTITYSISTAGHVDLQIYDLAGRHVSTLVSERVDIGEHQVHWDAKDDAGEQVSSGVYLYQLRAGDFVETKRMVLLK